MISPAAVSKEFRLDLEPNFSKLLTAYISSEACGFMPAGHKAPILKQLESNLLPLLGLKELLAGLPDCHKRWDGTAPLKTGEQLFLNHLILPEKYSLLTAMFNQYAPNNMFKIAWAYIAEDAERKYGVLFIERQREGREQEENAIYEFSSFIHVKTQNLITHYSHHLDHFAIDKKLRLNLVFEGFRKTGELITACNTAAKPELIFKVKNMFNSIINPLYTFFQDIQAGSGKGAGKTSP